MFDQFWRYYVNSRPFADDELPNIRGEALQARKSDRLLAQETSDRTVTPVFRAGSTPGAMEVELKVKDELPVHGSVEANGRNTEGTTRLRLVNSIRYDNLWQKFHSASLQYQVSPQDA